MIVGTQSRRRRRLGQDYDIGSNYDVDFAPLPGETSAAPAYTPGGDGCSTWQMLWGNLTGDYSGCIAANQEMVQAVATNAATYYPPNVAEVAQSVATTQEAQVPADVYSAASSAASATSTWMYYALAALAIFAVIEIVK